MQDWLVLSLLNLIHSCQLERKGRKGGREGGREGEREGAIIIDERGYWTNKQVTKHYIQLLISKEREGGIEHLKKQDIWTNK